MLFRSRLSFTQGGEILKPNFVGFVFNTLFAGTVDFSTVNLHKNKAINTAASKAKGLKSMVTVLLEEYGERKARQQRDVKAGRELAIKYGIGTETASLKAETKAITERIEKLLLPAPSAAKVKNAATKAAKVKVAEIATSTEAA